MTEQYARVENRIAEMQESTRSLEHALVTVDNGIAFLQQEAQEPGDVSSTRVREALDQCVATRARLRGELEDVSDAVRDWLEARAEVVHILQHMGAWKWSNKPGPTG
jgi:predicted  nucleic acid-binding Zn-ribbon protein